MRVLRVAAVVVFTLLTVSTVADDEQSNGAATRRRRAVGKGPRLELFVNPSDSRVAAFTEGRRNTNLTVHATKNSSGMPLRLTHVESANGLLSLRGNGQPAAFRTADGTTVEYDFASDPFRLIVTASDGRRFEVVDGTVKPLDSVSPSFRSVAYDRAQVIAAGGEGLSGTVTRMCEGEARPVAGATVFGRYHLAGGTTCPSPSFTAVTGEDGRFAIPAAVNSAATDTISIVCDALPDLADHVCEWIPPDLDVEERILTGCPGLLTLPPPFGEALASACVGAVTVWTAMCSLSDGCEKYQRIANDYYDRNCRIEGATAIISASHPDFGTVTPPSLATPAAVTLTLPNPNCENTRELHSMDGTVEQHYTWNTVVTCEGVVIYTDGGSYDAQVPWYEFRVAKKSQGQWVRGTCSREELRSDGNGTTTLHTWSFTYDYPMYSETLSRHVKAMFGTEDHTVTHNVHVPSGTMRGSSYRSLITHTTDCADRGTRGLTTSNDSWIRHARYHPIVKVEQLPAGFTEPLLQGICESGYMWTPH